MKFKLASRTIPLNRPYNHNMTRQVEAIFERGVLRPLESLPLSEKQHVLVTITDFPPTEAASTRRAEQEWLAAHGHEYLGQWVALSCSELLSHGSKARQVREEARKKGVHRPLLVHVTEDLGQPSAGWL